MEASMPDPRHSELADYLAKTDHATNHADFWTGWDAIACDLVDEVWSDNADPDMREAFTDLLASADDASWAVPDRQTQP